MLSAGRLITLLACALVLLTLVAGPIQAEEQAPESPNPEALATDWWTYFSQATETDVLEERITGFGKLIADATETDIDRKLADEIATLFSAYQKLQQLEVKLPETLTLQDSYTLDDMFGLVAKQQGATEESQFAEEKVKLEELAIQKDREKLNQRKLLYLQQSKQATQTLADGLEIIRERLSIEIRQLRLDSQAKQLNAMKSAAQQIEGMLFDAYKRLTITPDVREALEQEKRDVEESLTSAEDEVKRLRNQVLVFETDQSRQGVATENLLKQQQLLAETRLNVEALRQVENSLATLLIDLETDREHFDRVTARDELKKINALLSRVTKANTNTARLVQKNREANVAQANTADTDSQLLELYTQLDATDKKILDVTNEAKTLVNSNSIKTKLLDKRLRDVFGAADDLKAQTLGTLRDTWDYFDNAFATTLFEVNETPVTTYSLVRFVIIMLLAWGIAFMLKRFLTRIGAGSATMSSSALYTLAKILSIIIVVVAFLIALTSIGIDVTKFALIASALSIGIGFGLQNMINNFVSGIILLFERSLKISDFVELESGVTGEVKAINIRSTIITTNDNVDIIVPNSEFVSNRVINWTMRQAFRRIRIPFGVAYGTDKSLVRRVVIEAADALDHTLNRHGLKTQVWLTAFGESSLDFELVVWVKPESVKRPGSVTADYCWAIETALISNGIEIPFPQRDLHMRSGSLKIEQVATEPA